MSPKSSGELTASEISEVLTIHCLSASGYGLAKSEEGKVYFVRGAVPGDQLSCRVQKSTSSYSRGVKERLVKASALRSQTPPCSVFGRCGGCLWMDVPYSEQLKWKKQMLLEALAKHFPRQFLQKIPLSCHPSSSSWSYRSRLQLRVHFGVGGRRLEVGFFAPGTHSLVPLKTCHIVTSVVGEFIEHLQNFPQNPRASSFKVLLYIQQMHEDTLSPGSPKLPLAVKVGAVEPGQASLESFVGWMREKAWWVGMRKEKSPLALWHRSQGLEYWGEVGGFFQSHKSANDELRQNILKRACELGVGKVYDLYSGSGNFSLPLIASGMIVVGVEESKESVRGAEFSRSKLCNHAAKNSGYVRARAEVDVKRRVKKEEKYDLLLLNPPRRGASQILPYLSSLGAEHLFYVSCYPLSLASDLATLLQTGTFEHINSLEIFDFYPHSPHFETWVHLSKKNL